MTRHADGFLWCVVVEGAVDRFLGRPRDQNPYCGQDSGEAWLYGWDEAEWLLDIRGMNEVRRWLRDAA